MQNQKKTDTFAQHDHHHCRHHALERAEAVLAAAGARVTPVRRRVLEILLEDHRALGAYDVLDRLAAEGHPSQPPIAYRALEFLVAHGVAHRINQLNAFTACMQPDTAHIPVFMICKTCQKVAETSGNHLPSALGDLGREMGFTVERADVELLGLCDGCALVAS